MENNLLGSNIKTLRAKFCMTQDVLANKLNVDRTLISHWENGHRKPSMDDIKRMSEIFGVEVKDLTNCNLSQTSDTDNINNEKEEYKMSSENCAYKTETQCLFGDNGDNEYRYLRVPRIIILPDTEGFREYMKGLDRDKYLEDHPEDKDVLVEMVQSYWNAFEEGIVEAGVNLMRRLFLIKLNAKANGDSDALQDKFKYLIEGLQAMYHPAGDFYHALSLFCGLLDNNLPDDECIDEGLKELYELANDGNIYAKEVVIAIEEGTDEIEE